MTATTNPSDDEHLEPAEAARTVVDGAAAAHEAADHTAVGQQGHGDDTAEPLGPVDWGAWAGGILGAAAGLLVAGCLWLSTSGL